MGIFQNLKKALAAYKPLSYYIVGIILSLPVYGIAREYLLGNQTIFIHGYSFVITKLSLLIGSIFNQADAFQQILNIGKVKVDTTLMALWQTILIIAGTAILPINARRKVFIIVLGLLVMILFNVLRLTLILFNESNWHVAAQRTVGNFMIIGLNIGMIWLLIEWFKHNFPLKKLLIARLNIAPAKLRETVSKVVWVLFFLALVNFITNTQLIPVISYMVLGILKASEWFLHILGYAAEIFNGRTIQGVNAAIYFSDSCLGLELMLTFACFIGILGGKVTTKIWYIASGMAFIYLLNILRISLIFVHLAKNNGYYNLSINYHDIFTYPVYVVVFILWAIWINRFNKGI